MKGIAMVRTFIFCVVIVTLRCAAPGHAAESSAAMTVTEIDALVERFNPDVNALDAARQPQHGMSNALGYPFFPREAASDIAADVAINNWFNLLVYLPFLILPQVLLVVVIFKFRDRKDGRKPATFTGNHKLEIIWTAIPCLALLIVAVPVWKVLYKMELPPEGVDTSDPKQATVVNVYGKKFAWDYKYKHEQIEIGQDLTGAQEPLVIVKDRPVVMAMTSNDVNHAWWIPAFGVKRDCIAGRFTNQWFTPKQEGFFKGQCAELCGTSHGLMIITAVVVRPEEFTLYTAFQRNRNDAAKVWNAVQPPIGQEPDEAKVKAAVDGYFTRDRSDLRRLSLRYWIASNFVSMARKPQGGLAANDFKQQADTRRAHFEALLAQVHSATPAVAVHN
jgi:cytochrome c oxidase subunit II